MIVEKVELCYNQYVLTKQKVMIEEVLYDGRETV